MVMANNSISDLASVDPALDCKSRTGSSDDFGIQGSDSLKPSDMTKGTKSSRDLMDEISSQERY